jgi:hypothetical protein
VTHASGPFQLTVKQPSPSSVQSVSQTSFIGKGQQVTNPFTLAPGTYTVTATNDSTALRVPHVGARRAGWVSRREPADRVLRR